MHEGSTDCRWIGVAGLVAAALDILSFAILFPGAPEANRGDTTIVDWYADSRNHVLLLVSAVVAACAVAAFLVFLTGLRRWLVDAHASPALADIAYAGGMVFAAVALAGIAVGSSVAATFVYSDEFELDADTARVVLMAGNVWLVALAGIPGGLFVAAACLAARRAGALPGWIVWSGFVIAVLAVLAFPLFGVNAILVVLWVLVVSLVLVRRAPAKAP
jgi:hypothetical protein